MTKIVVKEKTVPGEDPAAQWVNVGKLIPWEKNPRKNEGVPVDKVADSIRRFGFATPIVARKSDGRIIAGHTRFKAAKKLGMKRVPVRYVELSDVDATALSIADNRLNEEAPWDRLRLTEILTELKTDDYDLVATGFNLDEVDAFVRLSRDVLTDASTEQTALQYQIVIECGSEREQGVLLNDLETRGLKCKPLIL